MCVRLCVCGDKFTLADDLICISLMFVFIHMYNVKMQKAHMLLRYVDEVMLTN